MRQIKVSDIDQMMRILNRKAGFPHEEKEGFKVGRYYTDCAYNGYGLIRILSKSGACRSIIGGFSTKREFYQKLSAFIDGFDEGRRYQKGEECQG